MEGWKNRSRSEQLELQEWGQAEPANTQKSCAPFLIKSSSGGHQNPAKTQKYRVPGGDNSIEISLKAKDAPLIPSHHPLSGD